MKCIECDKCRKGWFKSKPAEYVCIGVREPFVIQDVGQECTEYAETKTAIIDKSTSQADAEYYVDDRGIYRQVYYRQNIYQCVMTREMFVEAYNKWIKGDNHEPN